MIVNITEECPNQDLWCEDVKANREISEDDPGERNVSAVRWMGSESGRREKASEDVAESDSWNECQVPPRSRHQFVIRSEFVEREIHTEDCDATRRAERGIYNVLFAMVLITRMLMT